MKNLTKLSRNEMVKVFGGDGEDPCRQCDFVGTGLCCKCGHGVVNCWTKSSKECSDFCTSDRQRSGSQ